MSFTKKIVGPDEKLIGVARIHWIYGMRGLMWLIGFLAIGIFIDNGLTDLALNLPVDYGVEGIAAVSNTILWICIALGSLIFLLHFLTMISTEAGLTTKRVIYKTGLIFVDVTEVDIEEIKGANVDNGLFGRFLNYGYVLLDARFIENVNLPAIAGPYRFVKALNELRSREHSDSMKLVLEGIGNKLDVIQKQNGTHNGQEEELHGLREKRYQAFGGGTFDSVKEVLGEARESMTDRPARSRAYSHPDKKKPIVFHPQNLKGVLKEEIKQDFSASRK